MDTYEHLNVIANTVEEIANENCIETILIKSGSAFGYLHCLEAEQKITKKENLKRTQIIAQIVNERVEELGFGFCYKAVGNELCTTATTLVRKKRTRFHWWEMNYVLQRRSNQGNRPALVDGMPKRKMPEKIHDTNKTEQMF